MAVIASATQQVAYIYLQFIKKKINRPNEFGLNCLEMVHAAQKHRLRQKRTEQNRKKKKNL